MTMIELAVGMAVSAIVLAGVLAIATATTRTYSEGRRLRERQGASRTALEALELSARLAGFGMDPQFAFDFDFYRCDDPEGASLDYATDACKAGIRDRVDGPDELVIYRRNPTYQIGMPTPTVGNAWVIPTSGIEDPTRILLLLHPGDFLPRGQILQIVCPGAMSYTYVTVAANVTGPQAEAPVAVTLAGESQNTPFRQNGVFASAGAAGCFNEGGAVAYRIERQRFFVMSDTSSLVPTAARGDVSSPRSYLMLDTGTDRNADGKIDIGDLVPLAPDVADLQVAFLMNNRFTAAPDATYQADSNSNWVWGDARGVAEELTADISAAPLAAQLAVVGFGRPCGNVAPDLQMSQQIFGRFDEPCVFDKALEDPYRKMDFPGNVRAVRISLVSRTSSPTPEATYALWFPPGKDRSVENRPSFDLKVAPPAGFAELLPTNPQARSGLRFQLLQTTVTTNNLMSGGMFMF